MTYAFKYKIVGLRINSNPTDFPQKFEIGQFDSKQTAELALANCCMSDNIIEAKLITECLETD